MWELLPVIVNIPEVVQIYLANAVGTKQGRTLQYNTMQLKSVAGLHRTSLAQSVTLSLTLGRLKYVR